MRPANFPARRERRRLRANMPAHHKREPQIPGELRELRTKKRRSTKAKR